MTLPLDERFSTTLHGLAHLWRLELDRRLKDFGLGRAGWQAISAIARAPEPMSQIEVSNLLGVEGATMVSTLDRLEGAGFVKRIPSPTDRRVKHVALTDAGQALYGELKTIAAQYRQELLADVSEDDLELVTRVLERLKNTIERPHR
ncbi:MAG: MarR family transcriptional regulator [Rhodocyclaceae bacterium]